MLSTREGTRCWPATALKDNHGRVRSMGITTRTKLDDEAILASSFRRDESLTHLFMTIEHGVEQGMTRVRTPNLNIYQG